MTNFNDFYNRLQDIKKYLVLGSALFCEQSSHFSRDKRLSTNQKTLIQKKSSTLSYDMVKYSTSLKFLFQSMHSALTNRYHHQLTFINQTLLTFWWYSVRLVKTVHPPLSVRMRHVLIIFLLFGHAVISMTQHSYKKPSEGYDKYSEPLNRWLRWIY